MDQRIKLYSKCIFGFAKLCHYVPFKYKFNNQSPDKIVTPQTDPFYKPFAVFSTIAMILFGLNFVWEAFFGIVDTLELTFIIGMNTQLLIVLTSELYYIREHSRTAAISIINAVLENWFKKGLSPTLGYEIVFITFGNVALVYPFLWFPVLLSMSTFLPRMFRTVHSGAEILGNVISPDDSERAELIRLTILLIILAVFSVGLGHGVVAVVCLILWVCAYHLYTVQSLRALLTTTKRYSRSILKCVKWVHLIFYVK